MKIGRDGMIDSIYSWILLKLIGDTPVVANVRVNCKSNGILIPERLIMTGVHFQGGCDMDRKYAIEPK